jgi:hypothetical protein
MFLHYLTSSYIITHHLRLTPGIQHFDLSYDGFEQLAHPVYGITMLEYRPVDCNTKARTGPGLPAAVARPVR